MNQNPENQKSPQALREEEILKYWEEQDIFAKTVSKESSKGDFIFFEGPPTANGRPGLHHAEARSFKDIIPRYKTMQGFQVHRKAGWDTHGLPVELQVEKKLGLKSKKEIETYGVAAFNQQCKESVWEYKEEWERLTERMGFWLDMKDPYVTYNNSYIEALWSVVKRAHERGHLYRDFRVGPWCTRCGTQLSSHELNQPGAYQDVKDLSVYVKFKLHVGQKIAELVSDEKTYIVAWTTTPWTLPGNVALAVGNEIVYAVIELVETGEKYVVANDLADKLFEGKEFKKLSIIAGEKLIGLTYEPLYPYLSDLVSGDQKEKLAKAFQVYAADFVTTTDGTGIVHTAVMYGAEDFELGTAIGLPKFHLVNEEGKFIADTGFLAGRYVKESDENGKPTLAVDIVDDLTRRNLLWKKENHLHSYPHCWRCQTPLIYYARTSWYFRMSALRDQMMKANETINWEPDHVRDGRFGEWLDGIKDWAISRDRYWGTPLPVWTTADDKRVVVGSLDDLKTYAKKSGNKYFGIRHGEGDHNVANVCSSVTDYPHHLTEAGRAGVQKSAEELRGKGITKIITSPFVRTRETAEIVAGVLGIPKESIVFDDRLREFGFGDFHLKSKVEYNAWRQEVKADFFTKTPGGESVADAKFRIAEWLYETDQKYQNETILFVSHGIAFEVMPFIVSGSNAAETWAHWRKDRVPFADVEFYDFVSLPHNENYELDFHKPFIDDIELELDGQPLKRTPEVMDVWFDSGCMPYAQDHVLGTPTNFDPKPADYIAEGLDQTRGWFYTLHAVANLLHDTPSQAYKNVICMGLLMDAEGQKMSKSRGNVIGPWEMFDKYGADTVRLWMYSVNQPGDSKNFDEKTLAELQNKFFRVIENCVQILEMYGPDDTTNRDSKKAIEDDWEGDAMEEWCRTLMVQTDAAITKSLDSYDTFTAARALRDFVTEISQWYIRRSRETLREHVGARGFLRSILRELARMSAPFVPFTAEWLWQTLGYGHNGSIHEQDWGEIGDNYTERHKEILAQMQAVRDLATLGLAARQKVNVKVRQPLQKISVPTCELSDGHLEILKDELNVKEIVIDEKLPAGEVMLDIEITFELKLEGQARELMRALQDMRKKAGLNPTDMIALTVETDDVGRAVIESFKSEIEKVVNISNLSFESNDGEKIKVDELVFKVKI